MRLPHAVSTILMTVLTLLLYRSSAYSTSVAPSVDMSGWTQLPGAGLNVEDRNARVSEVRIERKSGIFNPGKYPRDEAEEKVVGRANVRGGFGPSVSDGSNFNSFPEPYPCAHSCLHGYCSPVCVEGTAMGAGGLSFQAEERGLALTSLDACFSVRVRQRPGPRGSADFPLLSGQSPRGRPRHAFRPHPLVHALPTPPQDEEVCVRHRVGGPVVQEGLPRQGVNGTDDTCHHGGVLPSHEHALP